MHLNYLPVRHYFLPVLNSKYTINVKNSAFPSDKCLNFLPVHLYFYLSRTGGQSIISIPAKCPWPCNGLPKSVPKSKIFIPLASWLQGFLTSYSCKVFFPAELYFANDHDRSWLALKLKCNKKSIMNYNDLQLSIYYLSIIYRQLILGHERGRFSWTSCSHTLYIACKLQLRTLFYTGKYTEFLNLLSTLLWFRILLRKFRALATKHCKRPRLPACVFSQIIVR